MATDMPANVFSPAHDSLSPCPADSNGLRGPTWRHILTSQKYSTRDALHLAHEKGTQLEAIGYVYSVPLGCPAERILATVRHPARRSRRDLAISVLAHSYCPEKIYQKETVYRW
jgi:hypothetical protein